VPKPKENEVHLELAKGDGYKGTENERLHLSSKHRKSAAAPHSPHYTCQMHHFHLPCHLWSLCTAEAEECLLLEERSFLVCFFLKAVTQKLYH